MIFARAYTSPGRRLILFALALTFTLAGCSSSSTAPKIPRSVDGVVTGLAQACSGPPTAPAHPVVVTIHQGDRLVAQQTRLGSHVYRFSEPPGTYVVGTNQSNAVPITVTLQAGTIVQADLISDCS